LGKEPAQVLIAWGAHQGFAVIPKSVTESRIKVNPPLLRCLGVGLIAAQSNFEDFELSDEDFEEINKVGRANYQRANAPCEYNPP
jgi:L-glyceraldehyde reductase